MKLFWSLIVIGLVGCGTSQKDTSTSLDEPKASAPSSSGGFEDLDAEVGPRSTPPPPPTPEKAAETKATRDQLKAEVVAGNERKVLELSAALLSKDQNDIGTINLLGIHYLKINRPSMARLLFKRALSIDQNSSAIYNNLGLTYLTEGNERFAMTEFRKSLELNRSNPYAAANLGSIHLKYKNFSESRRLLEEAYGRLKENTRVASNFGLALKSVGEFQPARRVYESAIEKDNKDTGLLLNYAVLLVENLNDKTKGQEVVNRLKLLATDPVILEKARELSKKLE